ncbi:MAG: A/G-specific adenine glycosylase [Candidatus Izemoplasma sp.]|nr:A/G-specific adenine glycosylase [Candidatus Izemoplasma sp.]
MDKQLFTDNLLSWFQKNKRELPWRMNKTPYKVWVSEIMLQQTQVTTVIDYFNRFMTQYPHVKHLAHAKLDDVLKLWEGLGYYSRARNLKKTAEKIVSENNSAFPSDYESLLKLPGIGPYTAAAIMSIAYNEPYAAVDGNVYRVMARVLRIHKTTKDPQVKRTIKTAVDGLMPREHASDFTEALMELGALICLPKTSPHCAICPLRSLCLAYKHNEVDLLPIKQPRKKKDIQEKTVLVFVYNNKLFIKKRDEKLLNQLYGFVMEEKHLTKELIKAKYLDISIDSIVHLKNYTHTFTHLQWKIKAYIVFTDIELTDGIYVTIDEIKSTYSLPRAFNQLLPQIQKALKS